MKKIIPLETKLQYIKELIGGTVVFKLGLKKTKNKIEFLSVEKCFEEEKEKKDEENQILEEFDYIG